MQPSKRLLHAGTDALRMQFFAYRSAALAATAIAVN
jgi:hypothetical protein